MKSGDLKLVPVGDLMILDERSPSDPAEYATHDDAFLLQQQKIERLNKYYDEVVAELLTLLNQSDDEDEGETGLAPAVSALP